MIRRIAAGAALVGAAALVLRALAPKLHARMLAACEHMFDEMPDTFPPKRMLRGIDEIRVNSARTVELLEERGQAVEREQLDEAVLS
jgi:hypothetical protein